MVEVKTVGAEDRSRSMGGRFLERIGNARLLIAVFAAFVFLLAVLDFVTFLVAAGVFAVLVLLIGSIPRVVAPIRSSVITSPEPTIWPETGVKRFAGTLPGPCFVIDHRGIVRFSNAAAAEAFSIKPGEPLSFRLRVPELNAAFDRVAKGGEPERVEFSERVPTERWFGAWFARLDSPQAGNFVVLILEDLSEQHRIDRIRVDFVANASHELRTPLASLAGFIETLQGSARDDAEARTRFLAIMHDQATRMSRLIDDLLSLSRVELKVHVRPSDTVDLVPTLRHLTDSLEPLARDLGVVIEMDLPIGPVSVTGDRDELIQVFENLVENAIKYGRSGKRVVVTVGPAQGSDGAVVSIRDFGPGIAEEHVPRLTERFYRIDVEESRQHRGTGLGLAIVKHILARHGARLSIESRLGDGALFSVTFPPDSPNPNSEKIEYYQ